MLDKVAKVEYAQCLSVQAYYFRNLVLFCVLDLGEGAWMLKIQEGGVRIDACVCGIVSHWAQVSLGAYTQVTGDGFPVHTDLFLDLYEVFIGGCT